MKWLLILFLSVIIIPVFAQSTTINQTEYQKLINSTHGLHADYQQLSNSIHGLQIGQQNLTTLINGLHTEHTDSDTTATRYFVATLIAGAFIATVFFIVHSMQSDNIAKLVAEVKKINEDQDRIRKKRIRVAIEGISVGLNGLKKHVESRRQWLTDYHLGNLHPSILHPFEHEQGVADYIRENTIKYNCENANDVLDPELYRDVLRVSSRIPRIYESISQEHDIRECTEILSEIERIENTPLLREFGIVF